MKNRKKLAALAIAVGLLMPLGVTSAAQAAPVAAQPGIVKVAAGKNVHWWCIIFGINNSSGKLPAVCYY